MSIGQRQKGKPQYICKELKPAPTPINVNAYADAYIETTPHLSWIHHHDTNKFFLSTRNSRKSLIYTPFYKRTNQSTRPTLFLLGETSRAYSTKQETQKAMCDTINLFIYLFIVENNVDNATTSIRTSIPKFQG